MLDREALQSILPSRCSGHEKPVIVTGRKPECWKCRESGHLTSAGLEKKAPSERSPSDRVCYFLLACHGHASNWDKSGKTDNWASFTDPIP